MLDVLNRYAHGFVVVPLVIASRKGGLFAALESSSETAASLCRKLDANSGHLQVTLRLYQSLGWIDVDQDGILHATPGIKRQELVPDDLWQLLDTDMDAYLRSGDGRLLRPYIQKSAARWSIGDDLIADFCDSLLIVPVLALLAKRKVLGDLVERDFDVLPQGVRDEVVDLLSGLGWIESTGKKFQLTPPGEFMFERAMNLGLAESYRPLLLAMGELLFGDAEAVFSYDGLGDESHVDRQLNVIASGFMHDRFFSEVEEILISIFSREPLSEQPRYVADMGSGDGTFLKRVYETVRDKTPRGKRLNQFPLTMIGIDLNQASLDETSQTLGKIDHMTVAGDIGNPEGVIADIEKLGVSPDSILHVRSFLDHDRPYVEPNDDVALSAREKAGYLGAYVDRQGRAIAPASAVQSLVEHLARWSEVVTNHGIILLEVHCQDPLVVRDYLDQSESLYFDAIEGYSHQLLIEADVVLMAAAEAGLFPRRKYFRKYPGVLPYCRITLNLFEKRPYKVRMARPGDIADLQHLEDECWPKEMRAPREELLRRIGDYPLGQWVLELGGTIVGVVYTQRVVGIDCLHTAKLNDIGQLFDPNGDVVQLLSLNVLPEKQNLGLGDQLLDLLLMRSALQGGIKKVSGLTRCKDFDGDSIHDLNAYISQRDASGRPLDPILQFHHKHGATFLEAVENYRPEDKNNLGAGILLCYDFSSPGTGLQSPEQDAAIAILGSATDARSMVEACLRTALGPRKQSAFAWNRSLRDIGLDSLNTLEFRTLLQQTFEKPFSPTFFFSHPTPEEIADFLETPEESRAATEKPPAGAVNLVVDVGSGEASVGNRAMGQDPVAVIGMAGRFPGGANLEEYWNLLAEGRDAISEIPNSRWPVDEFYSDDPDAPGKTISRAGGFLENIDEFDAAFFNISPYEARLMDPQQRVLMEIHWEALENAGLDPAQLRGRSCGIFVGMYSHDYELLQIAAGNDDDLGAYYATGNSASIAAGRIAYFLGTRGPALTIDTACSSSLVAVHQAVQSLRTGQSDIAIASGVSLILSPRLSIIFSKAGMLAADGRCKAFDEAADGYVRSEGCGAVVLKKLSEAQRDGDRILGVLRGSAINQDGASNGLTAPNLVAQEELLRCALLDADLRPSDIDFIEAHGTGTNLGDPVEYAALSNVFGGDPDREEPLWLASAKTNIGHTEAAAGMAGLIKAVLAMQYNSMPAHLHFNAVNPLIDLEGLPAKIPHDKVKWSNKSRPLRTGVSSFGFSGTNAHVIVEEADNLSGRNTDSSACSNQMLTLSGKNAMAVQKLASKFLDWLPSQPDSALPDICFTSNTGRAHHEFRMAACGNSLDDLVASLKSAIERASETGSLGDAPKIAFIFTGQGSQYVDMARDLALADPVFRSALQECHRILDNELGSSLEEILYPAKSDDGKSAARLDATENTQPALFSMEYALARTLQAWGIEPVAVMGHSVGEYVAACIAGVFSLEDGLKLIAARGRLMGSLPSGGSMCAVLGNKEILIELLDDQAEISIAAYNGPENTVISGPIENINSIATKLEEKGLKIVSLQVSHAFHSSLMEPILPAFREVTRWARFTEPDLKFASNVTGGLVRSELANPEYWVSHIREPVKFEQSIDALISDGIDIMLEIGPHPVLTYMGAAAEALDAAKSGTRKVEWLHTLARDTSDWQTLNQCVSALYELGVSIDFGAMHARSMRNRIEMPGYAWQRKSFWFEDINSTQAISASSAEDIAAESLFRPCWIPRSKLDDFRVTQVSTRHQTSKSLSEALISTRKLARADNGYEDALTSLDEICAEYIIGALCSLGWQPQVDEFINIDGLQQDLGFLGKHKQLVSHFLQFLVQDGFLKKESGGWKVATEIKKCDPESRMKQLLTTVPKLKSELILFSRCAGSLADVLCGKVDPLQLIFPGGSMDDAVALYTDSAFAKVGNSMIQSAIAEISSSYPPDKVLRILEIGAGTGATTAKLLPELNPATTEYVFTDVSDAFLKRARSQFAAYPYVHYEILDIERDAASQGFDTNQFDIVIAVNVLHATSDMQVTLGNVKKLLAPNGEIVLIEGLQSARWLDMVFGLTDGWWKAEDSKLRPDHPLLSERQWRQLLDKSGFESINVVATLPGDTPRDALLDLFVQGLVTAQVSAGDASDRRKSTPVKNCKMNWAVHEDNRGFAAALQAIALERGDAFEMLSMVNSEMSSTSKKKGTVSAPHRIVTEFGDEPVDVICFWPVDCDDSGQGNGDVSEDLAACAVRLSKNIAQAKEGFSNVRAIWVVTAGARAIGENAVPVSMQSGLVSAVNVIRSENPGLDVRGIDFAIDCQPELAVASLYRELAKSDSDIGVAYRLEQRYVQRLVPVVPASGEYLCATEGCYVVIGGLGGIGIHSARWLAARGANHIVLASRSVTPGDAKDLSCWPGAGPEKDTIEWLEETQTSIRLDRVDISKNGDVERLLSEIEAAGWGPIHGIIHSAAVNDDKLFADLDIEICKRVLAPKVAGGLALIDAAKSRSLEFLLFHSSLGSILGLHGQGSYAISNAFMDSLAERARSLGIPATSVNWCVWRNSGLARTSGGKVVTEGLRMKGIDSISPATAYRVIDEAVQFGESRISVLPKSNIAAQYDAPDVLLLNCSRSSKPVVRGRIESKASSEGVRRLVADMPLGERITFLETVVAKLTVDMLNLDSSSLEREKTFGDLGMDSLLGLEFRKRIQEKFDVLVSPTLVWSFPTINAVVMHVNNAICGDQDSEVPVLQELPSSIASVEDMQEMSDDEALRMLRDQG